MVNFLNSESSRDSGTPNDDVRDTYFQNLQDLVLNNCLDAQAQTELSKLIILRDQLYQLDYLDWVRLVDFTILSLAKLNPAPEMLNVPDDSQNKYLEKLKKTIVSFVKKNKTNHANLLLSRKVRREIKWLIIKNQSPLWGIATASGKKYTQLISGLVWFFIIFVIFPYYSSAFLITLERRDYQEKISTINEQLIKEKEALVSLLNQKDSKIDQLNIELGQITSEKQEILDNLNTITQENSRLERQIEQLKANDSEGLKSFSPSLPAPTQPPSVAIAPRPLSLIPEIADTVVFEPGIRANNTANKVLLEVGLDNSNELYEQNKQTISLILVVIIFGALGSTISVIVRAEAIIKNFDSKDGSLFFTGFFNPIIGMSFAIFLFTLLESGMVKINLIDNTENKIYMYIAISFVAGFSERLVKDLIGKTEQVFVPEFNKVSPKISEPSSQDQSSNLPPSASE